MSRLENESNIFRENLISRNLYTPTDIYDINNPKVIDAINSISRLLRPGNAFDFTNTVIGRVIGPQTPITEIGKTALINLYTSQVKSTLVRKKLPIVNLNNIFNKKPIITKNIDFSITKEDPDNIQERIFNILKDFSGVNSLKNPIKYNTERIVNNFDKTWIYNTTELSTSLIKDYTGIGQKNHLELLLSNNLFSNNLSNNLSIDNNALIQKIISSKSIINNLNSNFNLLSNNSFVNLVDYYSTRYNNSRFYATSGDTINQQTINSQLGKTYYVPDTYKDITFSKDIVSINDRSNTFTWGVDNRFISSKGILGYTNAIFNILNEKNNAPFNKSVESININGETYYNGIRFGTVDNNGNVTDQRSYSVNKQMDSISKTIKPFGYSDDNRKNSPLYRRPIPKILFDSPEDGSSVTNNVMFSIENLAYSIDNSIDNVYEKGPNNGRILWFSPTILDFNETDTPNINATNFLGRSEPVYTYANTERKLTVNFYMIVDHVDDLININSFEQFQERIYNLSNEQKQSIKPNTVELSKENVRRKEITKTIDEKIQWEVPFEYGNQFQEVFFYFPNNVSSVTDTINSQYEINGLNAEFENQLIFLLDKIDQYYNINPNAKFDIDVKGYTSSLGSDEYNKKLSEDRSISLKNYILDYITTYNNKLNQILNLNILAYGEIEATKGGIYETAISINSEVAKRERKSSIFSIVPIAGTEKFEKIISIPYTEYVDEINDLTKENDNISDSLNYNSNNLNTNLINDLYNINNTDPIGTYQKIKDKKFQNGLITYTPYELYKRLTFLHQCTRQGRTAQENDISNSVFGKPPVIVFRLGDMYNTKAIISSLTIDFENELPWDLNPEGFGVQKMGCKVALSLNLIGGSSVDGPMSHILNADSRRFYANSQFEGTRLDKEEK